MTTDPPAVAFVRAMRPIARAVEAQTMLEEYDALARQRDVLVAALKEIATGGGDEPVEIRAAAADALRVAGIEASSDTA